MTLLLVVKSKSAFEAAIGVDSADNRCRQVQHARSNSAASRLAQMPMLLAHVLALSKLLLVDEPMQKGMGVLLKCVN